MDNKKIANKYYCEKCDYSSRNKYDFKKHLLTRKHKMDNEIAKNRQKIAKPISSQNVQIKNNPHTCICGKSYKFKSGLCKHRHKCILVKNQGSVENVFLEKTSFKDSNLLSSEMLNTTLQQQKQLIDTIVELSKDNKNTTNYYNNCNNKKMTINVFLNEKCKDAMNLKDFIENVKVSLEDLTYTKEHGYAAGISNILVKHLKDLDPKERPIHCSDKKRLQFYIKEENKWGKDTDNVKIDKSIDDVSKKQIKQIVEWQKQNPDYVEDDKLLNEYYKITRHVMGGGDIAEIVQNGNDIKKTISNEIEIKDAMIKKNNT